MSAYFEAVVSVIVGILFLLSATLHAAEPLTLEEAVVTAITHHPQMLEAKANVEGAEAGTGQAAAAYYPQVNLTADWSKGRAFFPVKESVMNSDVTADAISLKQTIYDFGRTAGAVEAARWRTSAAAGSLSVARQDVAFRVRSDFYLLLAAEKQVLAVKETVRAREAVFLQAGEFFRQGVRAKVDVARAEPLRCKDRFDPGGEQPRPCQGGACQRLGRSVPGGSLSL